MRGAGWRLGAGARGSGRGGAAALPGWAGQLRESGGYAGLRGGRAALRSAASRAVLDVPGLRACPRPPAALSPPSPPLADAEKGPARDVV